MCTLPEANSFQWWVKQLETPKGNQTMVGNPYFLFQNLSFKLGCLSSGEEPGVPAAALHGDGRDELLNVPQKEGHPSCLQDAAGKCTNISLVEQGHPSARWSESHDPASYLLLKQYMNCSDHSFVISRNQAKANSTPHRTWSSLNTKTMTYPKPGNTQ